VQIKQSWRQMQELNVSQTAMSLAYLSLLALVPVLSISFYVMTTLPVFARFKDVLQKTMASNLFVPGFSEVIVKYLNLFASKASQLSFLSGLVFFATALLALLTIDRTLNRIWGTRQLRPLARRVLVYWGLLSVAPLALAALLALNGVLFNDWLVALAQGLGGEKKSVASVRSVWFELVPWALSVLLLGLTYKWVPNTQVKWMHAWMGAAVATGLLHALKAGLALMVAQLPTYTVVYGAFAALPVLLVWLYLAWMAVLLGAFVAAQLR
jgi:membrane protein